MIVAACTLDGRSGHDAGRELLRRLYWELTGQSMPAIEIAERGKPFFPGNPLHFSITHTPRHAFCVLAHCPVGIDAEELDRRFMPSLISKVLSPAEQCRYAEASEPQRAFLSLWVLKEASVKLTGEGLRGYPNQTNFSPDDSRVQEWDGCLFAVMAENPEEGVQFHAF